MVGDQEEEQRHTWAMFRVYRVHGRETDKHITYNQETKEESGERNKERRRKKQKGEERETRRESGD